MPDFPTDRVDYGWIIPWHNDMLSLAYKRFESGGTGDQVDAFEAWCAENDHWLADFALFVVLKNSHEGRPWVEWPRDEALRDEATLNERRKTFASEIREQRFRQWVFYTQWTELRAYANEKEIRLFGDIPIFVAHDSSDVWANPDRFYLDEDGNPTVVAGVPPDYFSETGQRWGNPLYRWDVMKASGYDWWIARFNAVLTQVDLVRIDHFRGFDAYWEIPASEPTAVKGEWIPGPGHDFFEVLREALGELPIVAEDLGVITREVEQLRLDFGLPGMKVLQFAWSTPLNPFLPHNHTENAIVYSGTHDNNTTVGWWEAEVDKEMHHFIIDYLGDDIDEPNWGMIRIGMMSPAHTFIAPMQDILGLDSAARMNTPGVESGNWTWRFAEADFEDIGRERLGHLTWLYGRRPDQREKEYGDAAVKSEA